MRHFPKPTLTRALAASFALVFFGVAAASGSADRRPESDDVFTVSVESGMERFAGAPHGVDPVVTGPVSEEFRARQRALNCDSAVWPNIPADCFPG